ncbi:putative phage abortive infection protein [Ramlibacter sp. PS4R-6]|uniref:putative phage abortive infection protein n=1 Tax=Ramlibacter sp. PS4R-6 TaxID=3133438 RepID=UPI0030B30BFC
MKRNRPEKKLSDLGLFAVIAAVVVALWWQGWQWIDNNIKSPDTKVQSHEAMRGTFGDKFGAINALFSGLALAGVIFTILLQRRELRLQREDIEDQNETLRRQRFENSFFQLLSLHRDILANIELSSFRQSAAFRFFVDSLKASSTTFSAFQPLSRLTKTELHQLTAKLELTDEIRKKLSPSDISNLETAFEKGPGCVGEFLDEGMEFHWKLLDKAYAFADEGSERRLAHYFRNLYHVLRFVDDAAELEPHEKKTYARMVRAQLSNEELVAVLYNALARGSSEFGYPKMLALVRKYDLLQNVYAGSVVHPIHLKMLNAVPLEAK